MTKKSKIITRKQIDAELDEFYDSHKDIIVLTTNTSSYTAFDIYRSLVADQKILHLNLFYQVRSFKPFLKEINDLISEPSTNIAAKAKLKRRLKDVLDVRSDMQKYFKGVEEELTEQYIMVMDSMSDSEEILRSLRNTDYVNGADENINYDYIISSVMGYMGIYSEIEKQTILSNISSFWKLLEEMEMIEKEIVLMKVYV